MDAGLFFFVCCLGARLFAAEDFSPTNEILTAEAVRSLTAEQADRHCPVKLRGVVTFFEESLFSHIVQDETAGIYLQSTNLPLLVARQLVEVEGVTSSGEYAPVVMPSSIKILGEGTFPRAKPVSYAQLISGEEDSQFVEIQGIVRAVDFDEKTKYYSIEIEAGGGRLTVQAAQLPVVRREVLVDSTVKIRGVCVSRFNSQRQLFDIRLLVPHPEDLVLESPAPDNPFAIQQRPIEQLLLFSPTDPTVIGSRSTGPSFITGMPTFTFRMKRRVCMCKPGSRIRCWLAIRLMFWVFPPKANTRPCCRTPFTGKPDRDRCRCHF